MEDFLNGMDEDLWRSVSVGPYCADCLEVVGHVGVDEDVITQRNK